MTPFGNNNNNASYISLSDVASEHYWKILAERRRVALEEALKENEALHNKVKLLEEENAVVKEMMKEATELVQTLTVSCTMKCCFFSYRFNRGKERTR